jgi:hypothetical protein
VKPGFAPPRNSHAIDDVESTIDLATEIHSPHAGRKGEAAGNFDILDLLDHLIGLGIDRMNPVAGRIL